jgi:hypothetical protein
MKLYRRLGAIALCMLSFAASTSFITGCSVQTGTKVAQDIVNWTPALENGLQTIAATGSLLLPTDAPIFAIATAGFDAAGTILVAQAKAYLANPSASVLTNLQTAAVSFQQTVSAGLLQAAQIKDPASQKLALAAINGVATIVSTILALIQSISSKTAVARMSEEAPIKYAQVRALMDQKAMQQVASQYHVTVPQFFAAEAAKGF